MGFLQAIRVCHWVCHWYANGMPLVCRWYATGNYGPFSWPGAAIGSWGSQGGSARRSQGQQGSQGQPGVASPKEATGNSRLQPAQLTGLAAWLTGCKLQGPHTAQVSQVEGVCHGASRFLNKSASAISMTSPYFQCMLTSQHAGAFSGEAECPRCATVCAPIYKKKRGPKSACSFK